MNVRLFVNAGLRDFVDGYDPAAGLAVDVPEGTTARGLCERVKVPAEKVKLVFVNGRHGDWDAELREGDRITLFPPIAGG